MGSKLAAMIVNLSLIPHQFDVLQELASNPFVLTAITLTLTNQLVLLIVGNCTHAVLIYNNVECECVECLSWWLFIFLLNGFL